MKGFTLIELIITITFFAIAGAFLVFNLRNQFLGNLESDAQIISSRLAETQSRAIAGLEGNGWGIHFENATNTTPFYAIFPGTSYTQASSTHFLSQVIEFQSPTSGSSTDIIFNKLSGTVATTTSVIIRLKTDTSKTKTITVTAQGKITVE